MKIDKALSMAYEDSFPGEDAFLPLAVNPQQAVRTAQASEDVVMNFNASDQDIYYSFLKKVMQESGQSVLQDTGMLQLDQKIIRELWKIDMEMPRIMKCIAYSPEFKGFPLKTRYAGAAMLVCGQINPVLSLPELMHAKPLMQLDSKESQEKEIYFSYLKTVFSKNPALSIYEADKAVVRTLSQGGFSLERIKVCLDASLQFNPIERTGDQMEDLQRLDVLSKEKAAFFDEACKEISSVPKKPTAPEPTDEELYQEMQAKLRNYTAAKQDKDVVQYWSTVLNTMRDTVLQMQQAQSTCKVLRLWSIGIEKAAKEFQVEISPETQKLQKRLEDIMQQAQKNENEWVDIYQIMERLDNFSDHIVKATLDKRQSNPLLSLPEVKQAVPLASLQNKAAPSDVLYFAALKDVLERQAAMLPDEADILIVQRLKTMHKTDMDIMKCLTHSPAFRQLNPAQRLGAAKRLLEVSQGKGKAPERGGPIR